MKLKLILLIAVAGAIAATGAGWKWHHQSPHSQGVEKIAGWTWGDNADTGGLD